MLIFKEHELHYLIQKYKNGSELRKAIGALLHADRAVLAGCPDCISEETLLPDMQALKRWETKYQTKYLKAMGVLKRCCKASRNADVLALLAYCYFHLDKFSVSLRYYQRAIELDPGNHSLLFAFGGAYNRLSYEKFRKSAQGKKLDDWFDKYLKNKYCPKAANKKLTKGN